MKNEEWAIRFYDKSEKLERKDMVCFSKSLNLLLELPYQIFLVYYGLNNEWITEVQLSSAKYCKGLWEKGD